MNSPKRTTTGTKDPVERLNGKMLCIEQPKTGRQQQLENGLTRRGPGHVAVTVKLVSLIFEFSVSS